MEPRLQYTLPDGLEVGPLPGQGDTISFWLDMVNDQARPDAERISAFMALLQIGVKLEVSQSG